MTCRNGDQQRRGAWKCEGRQWYSVAARRGYIQALRKGRDGRRWCTRRAMVPARRRSSPACGACDLARAPNVIAGKLGLAPIGTPSCQCCTIDLQAAHQVARLPSSPPPPPPREPLTYCTGPAHLRHHVASPRPLRRPGTLLPCASRLLSRAPRQLRQQHQANMCLRTRSLES